MPLKHLPMSRRERFWQLFIRLQVRREWKKLHPNLQLADADLDISMNTASPVKIVEKEVRRVMVCQKTGTRFARSDKAMLEFDHLWLLNERWPLWGKKVAAQVAKEMVEEAVRTMRTRHYQNTIALALNPIVGVFQEHWWERLFGLYRIYIKTIYAAGKYDDEAAYRESL